MQDSEFPADDLRAGYHARFRGEKAYNGMATLSRSTPEAVFYGFKEGPDSEAVRILEVVVAGLPIVNTYVPQGYRVDSEKYAFKLEWFRRMRQYFDERLNVRKPAVWTGDMKRRAGTDRRISSGPPGERRRFSYRRTQGLRGGRRVGVCRCLPQASPGAGAVYLLGLLPQRVSEQLGMAYRPHHGDTAPCGRLPCS